MWFSVAAAVSAALLTTTAIAAPVDAAQPGVPAEDKPARFVLYGSKRCTGLHIAFNLDEMGKECVKGLQMGFGSYTLTGFSNLQREKPFPLPVISNGMY